MTPPADIAASGESAPAPIPTAGISFPRLNARTSRFTLGEPRNITVTADGASVLFVRTASGVERTGMLWAFDVKTGGERLLADPGALLGEGGEQLSDAERARRERARESGAGIVGYSVDEAGRTAVFALSGSLWACEVATGICRELPCSGPVVDPRIDPTGRSVAYAADRSLRVTAVDGSGDRQLVGPAPDDPAEVVWGQAEFIAAEEMDRYRGFWWAPDGTSLLVERYDNAPVRVWYLADPTHPDRQPIEHRYPAAGTANAEVGLWHVTLDGHRREVPWRRDEMPYLGRVSWTEAGAVIQVLSRDQRRSQILRPGLPAAERYDADRTLSPVCELLVELRDPAWVDLVTGLPALAPDGGLLTDDAGYVSVTGAEVAAEIEAAAEGGVGRIENRGGQIGAGKPAANGATAEPTTQEADTHRLMLDGVPLTPPGMQLRAVLAVTDSGVLAIVTTEPTEQQLVWVGYDGSVRELSAGAGIHSGAVGGDTVVIASTSLETTSSSVTVHTGLKQALAAAQQGGASRSGSPADKGLTTGDQGAAEVLSGTGAAESGQSEVGLSEPAAIRTYGVGGVISGEESGHPVAASLRPVGTLANLAAAPPFQPKVALLRVGDRRLNAALILPRGHRPGSARLPVIMAPYGGPHAQLVRASGRMFLQAQWLADQGFAVIVADGRGSPGRGPAWERVIRDEFAAVTLADQVDALRGVAAEYPEDIDVGRVGIMGWSYGGYLSALAVLDRPDVFHAAVAGAPVTDWTLYDTCYTERYLGDPAVQPEVYEHNSLIERAPRLTRPLLIVHGLADDNVVVAHTLRLSAALLAAGREHRVLPLTGITHMASDEVVAENLLTAQVRFLAEALAHPLRL